ncbi:hypothetical protein QJS10_CPA01g02155 [Acorus calamus]|uniref:Succinate dehydrogenase assembly factor 4, mitochondrial n=1 Tax=Acorus calamus TaxID=4465 RepID=A0AAV9FHA5_ACOCL|nr:hypothetical protein QJS10_CPA01g02155 [Acorus calamus]
MANNLRRLLPPLTDLSRPKLGLGFGPFRADPNPLSRSPSIVKRLLGSSPSTDPKPETPKEREGTEEKAETRDADAADEEEEDGEFVNKETGEVGGPRGLEPTRYGDWEKSGRCYDF